MLCLAGLRAWDELRVLGDGEVDDVADDVRREVPERHEGGEVARSLEGAVEEDQANLLAPLTLGKRLGASGRRRRHRRR